MVLKSLIACVATRCPLKLAQGVVSCVFHLLLLAVVFVTQKAAVVNLL